VGSKVIRNVTKILKATSGRLFGRVTSGTGRAEELLPADVRTLLSVYSTTQVDTALTAKADLVGGVVPTAQIPAIAITEYLGSVASQAAMLLLDGDRGDWCLRSDLGTAWVLSSDDSSLLASWTQLLYPTAPVTSVAGRTGAVTLSTSDVSGLGSLATQSGTFSGTSSGTNTGDQNLFSTIAVSGQSDVVADATGDTLTLVAGTNISITTNAGSDSITINNTASGLSGTGSVDNAVLRADGTGGATLQSSAIVIDDLFTASPNNTVNFVCMKPTGGTTNVGVAIVPKGAGAVSLAVPDGASTGGNVRGDYSVDLQLDRNAAAQVASGTHSGQGGQRNTTSGVRCFTWGQGNTNSGTNQGVFGEFIVASGRASLVGGGVHSVSAAVAVIGGHRHSDTGAACASFGCDALADLPNQIVTGGTRFSTNGDNQVTAAIPLRVSTTNATPTEMSIGNSWDGNTSRLALRNNSAWAFEVTIIARSTSGANHASFVRRGLIYRNANAASTTIEGSVQTVGTDIASGGVSGWAVSITADTTNGALKIEFTGQAATSIRVTGLLQMAEVGFA
jgi:hypothetical protein